MNNIALIIIVAFGAMLSCRQTEVPKGLLVERWSLNEKNHKNDIFQKRWYSKDRNLVCLVDIDSVNKQTIDSILFKYDRNKNLVEQLEFTKYDSLGGEHKVLQKSNVIRYFYDQDNKLKEVKGSFGTLQMYERKHLEVKLRDTLSLLETELFEIDLAANNLQLQEKVSLKTDSGLVEKKVFAGRTNAGILRGYWVPQNEILVAMTFYHNNRNELLRDEFVFESMNVYRNYFYRNGLVKKIVVRFVDQEETAVFIEGFYYSSARPNVSYPH